MRSKLHILHVIDTLYPFGGTPVKLLYQALNSSGNFRFTICCIVDEGELALKFREAGVEVIALNYRKNYDLRQLRAIMRIIRERDIDIVHTHFARSNTYGRIAALLIGKPMIVSEHGVPRNTWLPMYSFDSILNLFTSGHISNSKATLRSAQRTIHFGRKNMSVIYNGVPEPAEEVPKIPRDDMRLEFGLRPSDFIVLYVGGLTFWRNHIRLVKAASKLRLSIPEIKVIFIGEGPAFASLKDAVKELNLEEYVLFWKYLERGEVHRFMRCADIYVNPAISEGFGIATVEAMLSKLPVICANSSSLPELIDNNKEGLLFEPKNTEELSQCILDLYQSKKKRKDFGQAARETALEKFSIEQFVGAFEQKYLSMVKS